jgi:hypothetical protein
MVEWPFCNWGAAEWTALATVVLAVVTVLLVVVGYIQLSSLRDEARKSRTLAACERYDTDPLLDASLRRLAKAKKDGRLQLHSSDYAADVITVLNILDAIAIGIRQDLYDEDLMRDHLESIVRAHFEEYCGANAQVIEGVDPNDFASLRALCERWGATRPRARR